MMNGIKPYQICSRCIMDTSDQGITFDTNGVCNHCYNYMQNVLPQILPVDQKRRRLISLIQTIKKEGRNRKYDCLIGLSGGVDSSYVVYLAKKYNLRALVVHFDNGWDSELAVKNIENIIKITGFDYFNYIVDWEEFKDLQRAYFKASVVDVEVPTDMGIFSLLPKLAVKFNIKYHLFGANIETETTMGLEWNFPKKMDRSNLEDIHRQYGTLQLRTFPYLSPFDSFVYLLKRVSEVNILLYEQCDYKVIKPLLEKEFGWRDYGVKHGESIFTKFYQSYFLPRKFGFDKRRAQLSDQINSRQITREEALQVITAPIYQSTQEEMEEYRYVVGKLGFTEHEFGVIMQAEPRSHYDFVVEGVYGSSIDQFILRIISFIHKVFFLSYRIRAGLNGRIKRLVKGNNDAS